MNAWEFISNVLYIDLTKKTHWVERREDLFSKWLGGIGVVTRFYKEEVGREADPPGAGKRHNIYRWSNNRRIPARFKNRGRIQVTVD
ncbi:MAG: hypothetical protein QXK88_09585 [Desulfurococcaceae archaeon]